MYKKIKRAKECILLLKNVWNKSINHREKKEKKEKNAFFFNFRLN